MPRQDWLPLNTSPCTGHADRTRVSVPYSLPASKSASWDTAPVGTRHGMEIRAAFPDCSLNAGGSRRRPRPAQPNLGAGDRNRTGDVQLGNFLPVVSRNVTCCQNSNSLAATTRPQVSHDPSLLLTQFGQHPGQHPLASPRKVTGVRPGLPPLGRGSHRARDGPFAPGATLAPLMHRISAGRLTQVGEVESVVLLNISITEDRRGDR